MKRAYFREYRFASDCLKCRCRVDNASIEEHPLSRDARGASMVVQCHGESPSQKGSFVYPRQSVTTIQLFLLDDAPPWFFDYGMTAQFQFSQ